jgi:1-acyl-sn-glycerol-3-phosphate acyltransferase
MRKLQEGRLLGIAPGGGLEAQCGSSNTYGLMWKNRAGFAHVAVEANVPILPVFMENISESVCNLQTGQWWWCKLYSATRIPAVPLYGGFPVKLTTHVGDPIWPDQHGGDAESMRSAVVIAMSAMIAKHQKLPGNVLHSVRERLEEEAHRLEVKMTCMYVNSGHQEDH